MATTILIVDDYPAFAETLELILASAGFATRTANDGRRALEILETEPIDLAILDVMMPSMSGLELCEHIRRTPRLSRLPIVMLSARTQVEDRLAGFTAGADDYIPKPADPKEIVMRVRALVRRTQRSGTQANVITFAGAKGGVGTSITATNVAAVLQDEGYQTVLIEVSRTGLTGAWLLNIPPKLSLAELCAQDKDINEATLDDCLAWDTSGLGYLCVYPQQIGYPDCPMGVLGHAIEILRHRYDTIIIDIGAGSVTASVDALRRSMAIIAVSEHNSDCIARLHNLTGWLCERDRPATGLIIVDKGSGIERARATAIAQQHHLRLFGVIPAETTTIYHAGVRREPFVRADGACVGAQAIKSLALFLLDVPLDADTT